MEILRGAKEFRDVMCKVLVMTFKTLRAEYMLVMFKTWNYNIYGITTKYVQLF